MPTVLHLHGGNTPADSDGFPTDLLHPVGADPLTAHAGMDADPAARMAIGERDYRYPMRQRAATLWYHDHRMDFTGPDVWRGLAGFHLVTDDEEHARHEEGQISQAAVDADPLGLGHDLQQRRQADRVQLAEAATPPAPSG